MMNEGIFVTEHWANRSSLAKCHQLLSCGVKSWGNLFWMWMELRVVLSPAFLHITDLDQRV